MSSLSRTLFVRPENLTLTNLLQTLAIARHLSARSNGNLSYFRFSREVDQSRLLNYASFSMRSNQIARMLARDSLNVRVPLDSRAANDYVSLTATRTGRDAGVGLKEVARILGINLHIQGADVASEETGVTEAEKRSHRKPSDQSLMLSDVEEEVRQDVYEVPLKLEKRLNEQTLWKKPQRSNRKGGRRYTSSIQQAMTEFGSFAKEAD